MTIHPTAPLTPAGCNLEGFPRMMIHVGRLRRSSFDAITDDAAWRAGVNLWLSSWTETPAGSLVNIEDDLIKAAGLGRDLRTWRRVREKAMHGWILCEDGRFYHPVVAETVLDAWLSKLVKRLSSGHGNAKRHGMPFDPEVVLGDIRTAADLLQRLDPRAEALQRTAVKKARAGIPMGVPSGEDEVPSGTRRGRNRIEGKNPPYAPHGGASKIPEWEGPKDILRAVTAVLGDAGPGYLLSFSWREVPEQALVTSSPTMLAKLKPCEAALRAKGWSLRLEKGAAA